MEQTVNQFTKGLQMDTNPMIQGSDTLTDALNATLVTMNGNEVILQNDMGNRRVDNAFLPPGYEPVGMKEYGGVIYVASYNPVTHHSQIGSFPSPERRISNIDNEDTGKTINFDFQNDNGVNYLNELCLKSDILLSSVANQELVLHGGDKFVIYGTFNDTSKITNYNNTTNSKITSPKNKLYTLSLGILNSQNEFVDITKNLVRWKKNSEKNEYETVTNFSNDSDDYKFNYGYFIPESLPNELLSNTINDYNFILERQVIPANTYSYKLCGPLYLKIQLNRPVGFSYNIYGYKTVTTKNVTTNGVTTTNEVVIANLTFDCFITYNCPDGCITGNNDGTDKYETLGISSELSNYSKFYDIKHNNSIVSNNDNIETKSVIYDGKSNLYTINQRCNIDNIEFNDNQKDYDYKILIKSGLQDIYLLDLSTKGIIDLSLLGSGSVKLTGWRFYNSFEQQNTILTYTFEAYPRYEKYLTNLTFSFFEYNPNSNQWIDTNIIKISGLDLNNGRNTISFNWEEKGFQKRKLYKVECSYDEIDNNGNKEGTYYCSQKPYFLTTELLNDRYKVSSNNFESYFLSRNFEFDVPIGIDINLKNNSEYSDIEPEGSLIGNSTSIQYGCKYTNNLLIFDNSVYKIINEELYPDFIQLREDIYPVINNCEIIKIGSTSTNDENASSVFNEYVRTLLIKNGSQMSEALDSENFVNFEINNSEKFIGGKIEHYDWFKSNGIQIDQISNAFCPISNVADTIFNPDSTQTIGCGLSVDYEAHDGGGDDHYLNLFAGVNPNYESSNRHNGVPARDALLLDSQHGDSQRMFRASSYETKINNEFNKQTQHNQIITYMYGDEKECYTTSTNILDHYNIATAQGLSTDKGCISNQKARVWMRTDNQGWALFKDLFPGEINTTVINTKNFTLTNSNIETHITTATTVVNGEEKITGHSYTIDITFPVWEDYTLSSVNDISVKWMFNGSWQDIKVGWNKDISDNMLTITTQNIGVEKEGEYRGVRIEIPKKRMILSRQNYNIFGISEGKLILDNIVRDDENHFEINNTSNGLFQFKEEHKTSQTVNNISDFVKGYFQQNYVYCAYDLYDFPNNSPVKLYRHDLLNCVYNEKYNVPITIGIKYTKKTNNIISPIVYPDNNYHTDITYDGNYTILNPNSSSGFSISGSNYLKKEYTIDGSIKFKQDYIYGQKTYDSAIQIVLSSRNEFQDEIQKYNDVSGVDISTGKYYDENNKKLDPNFIYSYNTQTGELQKEYYCNLVINKDNKINNINTLLYKGNNKGYPPTYRYNAIGWANGRRDHSSTIVDFSGINLITQI